MVYLDFSATTPVSKEVLDKYYNDNINYPGNANSSHLLGKKISDEIDKTNKLILKLLNLDERYEVVYTSGSSEANNLVINGLFSKFNNIHIITTPFEHSSILAPSSYLQKKHVRVDFVNLLENGLVDLKHLESLIDDDYTLVSIASVNSEIGILQDIEKISQMLEKYPKVFFHSDATQSIGKVSINLENVDFISFSAHKFYGLKGIGALVKKKSISIDSQIKGGRSTTKYRSGTPAHPLIFSLGFALSLVLTDLEEKNKKVLSIYNYLKDSLQKINNIYLNSNEYSIPHIVNFSVLGYNSIELVHMLSEKQIYISNHSACSSDKELSHSVLSLTKDESRARSSIRVSLSYLTTKEDIDYLIKALKEILK